MAWGQVPYLTNSLTGLHSVGKKKTLQAGIVGGARGSMIFSCCKLSCVSKNRGGGEEETWDRGYRQTGGKGAKEERVSGKRREGLFLFRGWSGDIWQQLAGSVCPGGLRRIRRARRIGLRIEKHFASKSKLLNIQLFGYDIDLGNTTSVRLNSMC